MKRKMKGFLRGFAAGFLLTFAILAILTILGRRSEFTRDPAAIDKSHIFDISGIASGALPNASAKQLLQNTEIVVGSRKVSVTLGHFLTRDQNGERRLFCDIYGRVELVFEAEGVAVSGKRPQFVVEGPCTASEDLNHMSPIPIPYPEFLKIPAGEGEFTFEESGETHFRAMNIESEWPKYWALVEVRFHSRSKGESAFALGRREIYEMARQPLTMTWK